MSREKLWPYIADTSRFNRYLGIAPRTETEVDGKNLVHTTLAGLEQIWLEEPWTWVREKSMQSIRHYQKGIAYTLRSNFFLEETVEGTNFYVNFSWVPRGFWAAVFLKLTASILSRGFEKALRQIEDHASLAENIPNQALKKANDPDKNVNILGLTQMAERLKNVKAPAIVVDQLCNVIKRISLDQPLINRRSFRRSLKLVR